jgi:RecJ-like exonuclease
MISSIRSKSEKLTKVMCVSHLNDVDGCACAALIRCATKSNFLLTNYGHFKQCLRNIKKRYNLVYVCDLGINKTILEEFGRIRQFAELTYIDHHPLNEDLKKELDETGIEVVHNLKECASVLSFNLLKRSLPREAGLLASYAALCDRLEKGQIASKLIRRFYRDFVFFEAMFLSYALDRADIFFKRRVVKCLSKLEYPNQIKGVKEMALKQADRITVLRKELPSRASKLDNLVYTEAGMDSSGTIANLLLDVCGASIGIGYNIDQQKQISDLSIRARSGLKIDLGRTTSQLAERFGGFGGGHTMASGARIPNSKITIFIQTLAHQIKKTKTPSFG